MYYENLETVFTQKLRASIDDSTLAFLIDIEDVSKDLLNTLLPLTNSFTPGDQNFGLIVQFEKIIVNVLNSNRVKAAFNTLSPAVRDIFDQSLEEFRNEHGEPFRSIITNAAADITNTERSFREMPQMTSIPGYLSGVLRNNINKQPSIDAAQDYLIYYIPKMLNNFFGQRVVNNYESFARALNRRFANGFNLVWAKYAGPEDNKNRSFCADKVNEFFHRSEVESWPEMEGDWEGRMPQTNSANISEVLGGFNCRHKLQWVSSDKVPEGDKQAFAIGRSGFL